MPLPPLEYKKPLVVPARSEHSATVFLLHGLGDTCDGWSDMATKKMWGQNLPHVKFVLPTAPVRPIARNGGFPSTAWYGVSAISQGERRTDEEGIRESIRFLTTLVEEEIEIGIKPERIVISGFSQGGAMALAMLRSPHKFAAIIGMSCYLPTLSDEPNVSEANKKTPVLMCHGLYDTMIPLSRAKRSFEVLEKEIESVRFVEYEMEHSACHKEMQDVQRFLEAALTAE